MHLELKSSICFLHLLLDQPIQTNPVCNLQELLIFTHFYPGRAFDLRQTGVILAEWVPATLHFVAITVVSPNPFSDYSALDYYTYVCGPD